MNQNPAFDSSIPVLTEVVLEPVPAESDPVELAPTEPVEATLAEPAPAEPMAAGSAEDIPILMEALPAAAEPIAEPVAEPDWDALELRIVERILAQLQPQLDAIVRNALASASDQIHIGLRQTVEQMVAQQVATGQK